VGAGPHVSVLGNCLQRGMGKGPYVDMSRQIVSLEVLLSNGQILETAYNGCFVGASIPFGTGAGPSLTGMFLQSELGIVLSATLYFHPAPAKREFVWARVDPTRLANVLRAIRNVTRACDHRITFEVASAARVSLQLAPDDPSVSQSLGAHDWLLVAAIYADSDEEMSWRRDRVVAALQPLADELGGGPVDVQELPHESGLQSAYRYVEAVGGGERKPDRDNVGLIWHCEDLPFTDALPSHLERISHILSAHGFEAAITLRPVSGACIRAVVPLVFDRRVASRDGDALACSAALRRYAIEAGASMYRVGLLDRDDLRPPAPDLWKRLHTALDPSGILSLSAYRT